MKSVLFKSLLVTITSIVASMAMTACTFWYLGDSEPGIGLLMAFLCPFLITPPISLYHFRQAYEIDRLCAKLALANQGLVAANGKLSELARRDGLTGLLNRSAFFDAAAPLCETLGGAMLVIDADHFKDINDTHGHVSGDMTLVAIAAAITGSMPGGALVARMGGEEFAVFLPAMLQQEAVFAAEAVRHAVENAEPVGLDGLALKVTVSVGAACAKPEDSCSALYRAADAELYRAKKSGRNRTCSLQMSHAA